MDRLSDYRVKLQERIDEAFAEYQDAEAAQDDDFSNDDARDAYCFLKGLQEAMKILDHQRDPNEIVMECGTYRPAVQLLTQADVDKMHFEKIWLSYGPGAENGEWAVVIFGRIYSIDTLDGAGLEDILNDLMAGETLDNPTGPYTAYRHRPEMRYHGPAWNR